MVSEDESNTDVLYIGFNSDYVSRIYRISLRNT